MINVIKYCHWKVNPLLLMFYFIALVKRIPYTSNASHLLLYKQALTICIFLKEIYWMFFLFLTLVSVQEFSRMLKIFPIICEYIQWFLVNFQVCLRIEILTILGILWGGIFHFRELIEVTHVSPFKILTLTFLFSLLTVAVMYWFITIISIVFFLWF